MATVTPAVHRRNGSAAAPPPPNLGMQGKTGEGAASALAHMLQAGVATVPAATPVFADNVAMTDHELTEAVRRACIEAALEAYESAGISGLCAEGRWEAAISAMQALDVRQFAGRDPSPDAAPRR